MAGHRLGLNLNIDNLFNQAGVLNVTTTPYRNNFTIPNSFKSSVTTPGVLSERDNYLLNQGFNVEELVSVMRNAGTAQRDNSLYGKPSSFQGRRQLRFGIRYIF
jgi:hypothetical protein